MRQPIAADEKLVVTLRFLAAGESYESLMYQFRIHRTTIGRFIPQVSRAIYAALKDEYLKVPSTEQEWEFIADETFKRWNFPNAFAVADGKHIVLFHPEGSGSEYYNYKGFYSLVLLAFVDYDYKFLLIDVGCQGRISDGRVFSSSTISSAINNDLNLPEPRPLPYPDDENDMFCYDETPVMFVADDAFPLTDRCMKPYSSEQIRRQLAEYFYGPGQVNWQWDILVWLTFMNRYHGNILIIPYALNVLLKFNLPHKHPLQNTRYD